MDCNRRQFFSESVKGLLGGMVSFGCAAGAVKELHAKEIHVAGGSLENMTVYGNIHVDASHEASILIRNISVVSELKQGESAITIKSP